ncbi:MAG: hypothetical protein E6J90_08310 [Deltaproteobacteria bacterium]|nr:MAG: hypothetical protein E6J90_08310 [Deltaproteobacteria bacterium]
MMRPRRALAVLAVLGAGCPSPSRPVTRPADKGSSDDDVRLARLYSELQDDILSSYDRDEPAELGTGVIDPRIGAARIGAGPGDFYLAGDLARAPSRWPLDVDRATRTEVRSKHLEIQISVDQSAGWMADELSWRIEMCGRSAIIPLRITALYAQDGDRWVPVVEHLSFGFSPAADAPPSRTIKTEAASGDLRDEMSGVLARGLFRVPHDPSVVAQGAGALVLGPDIADEWHGRRVLEARLPPGTLEDRRVGLIGRNAVTATIAYWVGKSHVFERRWFDVPGGPVNERKSCHFTDEELRKDPEKVKKDIAEHCRWLLVQSHMSQSITDEDLTRLVFGTALISPKPLQLDCTEGIRPSDPEPAMPAMPAATAPAAAPRPAASPRAGQNP